MLVKVPQPTPLFRIIHVDNLRLCIERGGLHATNYIPDDGKYYRPIHYSTLQDLRHKHPITVGFDTVKGTLHDYVPFYFGYRSPMLYALKHGKVESYTEGQEPLVYLVTYAQDVAQIGIPFVFSDGHGLIAITQWFDDLSYLHCVDWDLLKAKYWKDTTEDGDRRRRRQAEFLIYQFCPWSIIKGIGVLNPAAKEHVEKILSDFPNELQKVVKIKSEWYY